MNVCDLTWLMTETTALFENQAVGVAVVRDGIVERCNAKLEGLHGTRRGGLLGRRLEIFHGLAETGPGAGQAMQEARVRRDDGGTVWLRATGHATPEERGDRRVLWIVEDLTEREIAREATRRARHRAAEIALRLKHTAMKLHEELAQWRAVHLRDLWLEDRLRHAVKAESFELHYQPIVDAQTFAVRSMEALLRWRIEDGQWMPPSRFVPVAEACGLIHPLGSWTLREACRQACEWRARGLHGVPIAVNLSPCQLRSPDVVDVILGSLEEAGIGPGLIELEITETSLMENIDETLPKLHRLADHGVQLSIDDFGTGYSSLNYLRRLPISKLKIDQSFVRELQADRKDLTIVSAVIGLAKSLGLATVAEGVEALEQVRILQRLGCDYCQGYYFHSPAPRDTVFGMLDGGEAPALPVLAAPPNPEARTHGYA